MSVVASIIISEENIKIRWKEPFLSAGLNRKTLGTMLRGIYRGFVVRATDPATTGIRLLPDQSTEGTGDSVTAASGSTQLLTDSAGLFRPEHAARTITISGMSNGANNGSFLITQYISPLRVEIDNSSGVAETSAFDWEIPPFAADSVAVFEDPDNGYTLTVRYDDASIPISGAGIGLPLALSAAASGTGDSISVAGSLVTFSDAGANWTSADVGRYITIAGAVSGNNGTFRITQRVSGTQIKFFNPNASNETASFTWSVHQRHWVLLDVDYQQGVSTTGTIKIGNSVSDLAAYPYSIRLARIDIPTSATTIIDSYIVQSADTDSEDVDSTTRPWASDAKLGYANPGYRPVAEPVQVDFSTGAVTEVTLTGKYYVGRSTTGTASRYFGFAIQSAAPSYDSQLLGANRYPIRVDQITNPVTSAEVNPALDAEVDAFGFIENPIVVGAFGLVDEVDFSTIAPRVLAYKLRTLGSLTPAQTTYAPIRGFIHPALEVPVVGEDFVHLLTTTDDVQQALVGLDSAITGFGNYVVTVGPDAASFADFVGADEQPFIDAIAAVAGSGNGGQIIVLPGTYDFSSTVDISDDNIRISGLVDAGHAAASYPIIDMSDDGHTDEAFTITDAHNVTIENLTILDSRTVSATAPLVTMANTVAAREGPKFRNVKFETIANSVGALEISSGAASHVMNVCIDRCSFSHCGTDPVIVLSDVASWYITNTVYSSATLQNENLLEVNHTNYNGRVIGHLIGNRWVGEIGGANGRFVQLAVSGAAGDETQILVAENFFETTYSNPTASSLFHIDAATAGDITASTLIFRDNTFLIQNNGSTTFLRTDDPPGNLFLKSNYISTSSLNSACQVDAGFTVFEGNTIRTGYDATVGGDLVDVSSTSPVIFTGNAVGWQGANPSSNGQGFGAGAHITNNTFSIEDSYGISLNPKTVFSGNSIDMTAAGTATSAIVLENVNTGDVTDISITNNKFVMPTNKTGDIVGPTSTGPKDASRLVISGNYAQDCNAFVGYITKDITDSVIEGNTIYGCLKAIDLSRVNPSVSVRNIIRGNNFQYNDSSALGNVIVGIIAGADCVVTNNILQAFTGTVTSGGPVSAGHGLVGISVGARCVVSGNSMKDMDVLAHGMKTGADCSVTGNIITSITSGVQVSISGTYASGMTLTTGSTVTGNVIDDVDASNAATATDAIGVVADIQTAVVGNRIVNLTPEATGTITGIAFTTSTDTLAVGNVIEGGGANDVTGEEVSANNTSV